MDPLLQTIGELASATTLEAVALAVRLRARALVKADGVTFVLRETIAVITSMRTPSRPYGRGVAFH
jgi:hypothetical protein